MLTKFLGTLFALLLVGPLAFICHLLHHLSFFIATRMFLLKLWLLIEFGVLLGASVEEVLTLKQDLKRAKLNVQ